MATLRSTAISLLRLEGRDSIAASLRFHGRDPGARVTAVQHRSRTTLTEPWSLRLRVFGQEPVREFCDGGGVTTGILCIEHLAGTTEHGIPELSFLIVCEEFPNPVERHVRLGTGFIPLAPGGRATVPVSVFAADAEITPIGI